MRRVKAGASVTVWSAGRHHQHRVVAAFERLQRGQRQRRRRVAAHRLEQQRGGGDAQLAQLVEHQEAVLVVADDQRRGDAAMPLAVERLRGAPPPAGTGCESPVSARNCFGKPAARQRPQPRAAAAGHDHRLNLDRHGCVGALDARQIEKPLGLSRCQRHAVGAHVVQGRGVRASRAGAAPATGRHSRRRRRRAGAARISIGHRAAARCFEGAHHLEHAAGPGRCRG